ARVDRGGGKVVKVDRPRWEWAVRVVHSGRFRRCPGWVSYMRAATSRPEAAVIKSTESAR
ncbi:MAG: hypothetical protein ACRDQW_02705, partial [Haloechinothrix sp.]